METTDRDSTVSIVMKPTKEDDTVVLGDDAYYCLLVHALDIPGLLVSY